VRRRNFLRATGPLRARFVVVGVLVGALTLSSCASSSPSSEESDSSAKPAATTALGAPPTYKSEIIDTPEGVVTTGAPASSSTGTDASIAPGYSDYDPTTTVVAYLLKGEASVEVFASATDTTPSQTISRINGRTLPFVALGNTPSRIRVMLPSRPNGSIGWIDRTKLELRRNDWRIEIDREKFNLTLYFENKVKRQIPIGIGDEETPTPQGTYYTLYSAKPKLAGTVFGAFVIGLSGFSDVLPPSFNGSEARLGLHGTNRPGLLGSRISKGCIRMADADITFLVENLPLGTPVRVTA
jgi:lipoprotein-anchoring transpeptidase ErfK/SrfK